MRSQVLFGIVGFALLVNGCRPSTAATPGGAATVKAPEPTSQAGLDAEAVSDFTRRVERYVELRDKLQKQGTPQKTRENVGENLVSQEALATRIRAARSDARQGDIFTPAIAAALRRAMNPELRGGAAAGTREAIRHGAPVKFTFQVNGPYPEGATRSFMPANVLNILPPLPKGLEYRIVDTHLILMDVDANIVVDYLFDVMCAVC